jgi:hypothetical protein
VRRGREEPIDDPDLVGEDAAALRGWLAGSEQEASDAGVDGIDGGEAGAGRAGGWSWRKTRLCSKLSNGGTPFRLNSTALTSPLANGPGTSPVKRFNSFFFGP